MARNAVRGWIPIAGHTETISQLSNGEPVSSLEALLGQQGANSTPRKPFLLSFSLIWSSAMSCPPSVGYRLPSEVQQRSAHSPSDQGTCDHVDRLRTSSRVCGCYTPLAKAGLSWSHRRLRGVGAIIGQKLFKCQILGSILIDLDCFGTE